MEIQPTDHPTMGALGRLAVQTGLVTYDNVMHCVHIQKQRHDAGESVRLGAILVENGFLSDTLLETLLSSQKSNLASAEEMRHANDLFGGYVLLQRLGAIAECDTWRARHKQTGRMVILRIMQPEAMQSTEHATLLQKNIKHALQLRHPSLAPLFSAGRTEGRSYYTMTYTKGRSLRSLLDAEGRIPPAQALAIARDIAHGLAAAHAKGVCHLELRPSNILLKESGGLLVIGTGLSREPLQSLESLIRIAGNMPSYIAPEQAIHGLEPDPRSDIFALGAILYHMLTGHPPFEGSSIAEVLLSMEKPLASLPHNLGATVSPLAKREINALLTHSLAHAVEARYQLAGDMAADIAEMCSERVQLSVIQAALDAR